MKKTKQLFQWNIVTPLSKYLAMILFIALPFMGFVLGVKYKTVLYENNRAIKQEAPVAEKSLASNSTTKSTKYEVKGNCDMYGQLPITQFLKEYIVKQGDTLLSIAKKELNDASRASEIAELNKRLLYPELSLSTPFLEKGWKLYLPPKSATQTGGYIQAYAGEISKIEKDGFNIVFKGGGGGKIGFNSNTQFLFQPKEEYQVGDCIVHIEDVRSPLNIELYVFPQSGTAVSDFKTQVNN